MHFTAIKRTDLTHIVLIVQELCESRGGRPGLSVLTSLLASGPDPFGQNRTYSQPELNRILIVQELCESRGGRPGLSVLTSLLASVDVKIY